MIVSLHENSARSAGSSWRAQRPNAIAARATRTRLGMPFPGCSAATTKSRGGASRTSVYPAPTRRKSAEAAWKRISRAASASSERARRGEREREDEPDAFQQEEQCRRGDRQGDGPVERREVAEAGHTEDRGGEACVEERHEDEAAALHVDAVPGARAEAEDRHEAHDGNCQSGGHRLETEVLPAADVEALVLEACEQRRGSDKQECDSPAVDDELVGVERRRLQHRDPGHRHSRHGEVEPPQSASRLDEREPEQRPEGAQSDLSSLEARRLVVGDPHPELENSERRGVGHEQACHPPEDDSGGLDAVDDVAHEARQRALVPGSLEGPREEPRDESCADRRRQHTRDTGGRVDSSVEQLARRRVVAEGVGE